MHLADISITQYHPLLAVEKDCVGHSEDIRRHYPSRLHLASTPSSVDDQHDVQARFAVLLYDRASSEDTEEKVNEARKQLFSQKGRPVNGLPPAQAALVEHTENCLLGRSCLGTNVRSYSQTTMSW